MAPTKTGLESRRANDHGRMVLRGADRSSPFTPTNVAAEHEPGAEDDEHRPKVHRVPNIGVGTGHDDLSRRVEGCRGAHAFPGECDKAPEHLSGAADYQSEPGNLQPLRQGDRDLFIEWAHRNHDPPPERDEHAGV